MLGHCSYIHNINETFALVEFPKTISFLAPLRVSVVSKANL